MTWFKCVPLFYKSQIKIFFLYNCPCFSFIFFFNRFYRLFFSQIIVFIEIELYLDFVCLVLSADYASSRCVSGYLYHICFLFYLYNSYYERFDYSK